MGRQTYSVGQYQNCLAPGTQPLGEKILPVHFLQVNPTDWTGDENRFLGMIRKSAIFLDLKSPRCSEAVAESERGLTRQASTGSKSDSLSLSDGCSLLRLHRLFQVKDETRVVAEDLPLVFLR